MHQDESRFLPVADYEKLHAMSVTEPEKFWGGCAEYLHWYKKWDKVLDDSKAPFYRWFVGGKTNICYNAVDRHALGNKRGMAAIIWESPTTGQSRTLTYFQLFREVNRFAGVLKNLGVKKGDRVVIYMPMVPEAAVAMLACVRIGAIHSVVFGGFSTESLADRINDAAPKVVVCAEAGSRKGSVVPLKKIIDDSLAAAKVKVEKVIVLNRGIGDLNLVAGRDILWDEAMEKHGELFVEPEELDSTDPSYILYTSGTTGKPKGVVRDTGGYMVALHASMGQIYDVADGDVYFSTSDIGWVVGHSYIVYAPLLKGVPTVMFEGTPDHPNPGIWWDVVAKYGVTTMFSAPTAMRVLRKFPESWFKEKDLSSLKYVFLAGEPLDEPTYQWATSALGTKVIDHYWQTESGWPMLTNMPGVQFLPIKPGSPTKAAMGYQFLVVNDKGEEIPRGEKGFLVAKGPIPPGTLMTIWGDDERYKESYWDVYPGKNFYHTGDFAIMDKDGYLWMLGRADEVLNVAGHRLGTREVEEVLSSHPQVAETSVIGVKDELKGEGIFAFVVLKADVKPSPEIEKELVKLIRDKIGAIATPKEIRFIHALPKTRSGKIMRRVIKAVAEGQKLGDLSTIEDGATVDEVKKALETMGADK
jgi:propionyl-CoA synthetase